MGEHYRSPVVNHPENTYDHHITLIIVSISQLTEICWEVFRVNDSCRYIDNKVYTVVTCYGLTKAYYSVEDQCFRDISGEYVNKINPILVKID